MVQLEKIPGQVGHMVIQEDGTLITSSGELASNESTSQHIIGLVSNVFSVNFAAAAKRNSDGGGDDGQEVNGFAGSPHGNRTSSKTFKWNRVTVSFGDKSYVACLSNRKIHVAKRDHVQKPAAPAPTAGAGT